jgi:hypothetical protein
MQAAMQRVKLINGFHVPSNRLRHFIHLQTGIIGLQPVFSGSVNPCVKCVKLNASEIHPVYHIDHPGSLCGSKSSFLIRSIYELIDRKVAVFISQKMQKADFLGDFIV